MVVCESEVTATLRSRSGMFTRTKLLGTKDINYFLKQPKHQSGHFT